MNVLVLGGTGFIGRALCAELLERGHAVTALARNPADAGLPDGVTVTMGDVTARASIEPAFDGQDVAVNLVSLSPLFQPPRGLTHERVHLGGTRNVVAAAEAQGVPKLVQMSALGADPTGPTEYIRAKGRAERVVTGSDLEWTIFRPSVVFGDGDEFVSFTKQLTTPYVTALPGGGRTRFQPIWVEDLVGMLADGLADEHSGETYEIGGPEVLTLADVARLVSESEGRSLTVVSMPMGLARLGLSLADPLPFVPLGADQYRSLTFDNTVAENDVVAFGVAPADLLTFREYLDIST